MTTQDMILTKQYRFVELF